MSLFNSSVCVSQCVCVTFVIFTDCESCTRPISTNSVSMEVGGRGRTRGTCFITCRLEVVAVAGLLCLSWCVFGGSDFLCFFFQAEDGIRDCLLSRGLGDVYKRQPFILCHQGRHLCARRALVFTSRTFQPSQAEPTSPSSPLQRRFF